MCVGLDGAQTTPYECLAGSDIELPAFGHAVEEFFPADEFARVLEKEKTKFLREVEKTRGLRQRNLCPDRVFDRYERLENHVGSHHVKENGFICSGIYTHCRQHMIAKAIADNGMTTKG